MALTPVARPTRMTLHDFIVRYRDEIIGRTVAKLNSRADVPDIHGGVHHGVPLFLTQLADILAREARGGEPLPAALAESAARHGGELLSLGYTASQVVHTYGDICQAVTELAVEREAPITTEEFHTLNRCLDTAIAEAVTEHARLTDSWRTSAELERLGQVAHELRNHLNSAMLSFDVLRRGTVAVNGSTGAVLGRSLLGLREVVDSALAAIRMAALPVHREALSMQAFLGDFAVAAALHADYRGQTFTLVRIDPALQVNADPHLLGSAVSNLLNNAFKFTHEGGAVTLGASEEGDAVRITIEDECGGIPETARDPFEAFGERRGRDRTGLGLGLSIARKAVRSHGGDITIRNMPGKGCVFTIELPCTVEAVSA